MTKPEWGTKRTCQSCGAHFYDLRKDPIVCPKCGATYDPEAILKSRRRAPEKVVAVKPVKEPELPDPETDVETDDAAEETDDVIEDTSELGEDDADIPETIEPEEEGER
ncbi:TIGR02300 family protein [Dongia sp. agr-C8]